MESEDSIGAGVGVVDIDVEHVVEAERLSVVIIVMSLLKIMVVMDCHH